MGSDPARLQYSPALPHRFEKLMAANVLKNRLGKYQVDGCRFNSPQALQAVGQVQCAAPFQELLDTVTLAQIDRQIIGPLCQPLHDVTIGRYIRPHKRPGINQNRFRSMRRSNDRGRDTVTRAEFKEFFTPQLSAQTTPFDMRLEHPYGVIAGVHRPVAEQAQFSPKRIAEGQSRKYHLGTEF